MNRTSPDPLETCCPLTIRGADGKEVAVCSVQPSHPLLHPLHVLLPPVLAP